MKKSTGREPGFFNHKWIKIILGVLGAIVLGAIGSGLWELALKWVVTAFGQLVVHVISFFFSSYRDSIYGEASKGFNDESAVFLRIMLYMAMPLLYFVLLVIHPSRYSGKKSFKIRDYLFSKKGYRLLLILTLAIFVSFTIAAVRVIYTNGVATNALGSIEILVPYIDEPERSRLRSEFYMIQNEKDYLAFKEKIKAVAKENGIKAKKIDDL